MGSLTLSCAFFFLSWWVKYRWSAKLWHQLWTSRWIWAWAPAGGFDWRMPRTHVRFGTVNGRYAVPEADKNGGQSFSVDWLNPIEIQWELGKYSFTHKEETMSIKKKKTWNKLWISLVRYSIISLIFEIIQVHLFTSFIENMWLKSQKQVILF